MMVKFQKVTALLEQALSRIPYENLEISDELKEQVLKHSLLCFVLLRFLFLELQLFGFITCCRLSLF